MAAAHSEVWQRGTVVSAVALTAEIRRIEVDVDRAARVDPGAHVDVRMTIGGAEERRSYSIVDASPDGRRVALSVYLSPVTRGGATAMHALTAGDRIDLTQPLNDFPLLLGSARYALLAGGVGITAVLGMADRLRDGGADYRLSYAGRSRRSMAYIDEIERRHDGRLDLHVRDEGTSLSATAFVAGLDDRTEAYVCGPIRLMDAVRRAWLERGLPIANLRTETFGNSGWFDPHPFTVVIPALGIEAHVSPTQTMLEALEAAGADMLYDCRKGECGLCEVRIIDLYGEIDHRDVFYSERQRRARERMCCCVSRVIAPGERVGRVTILTS